MTIDDLAKKLAEMYRKDKGNKVLSVHLFGIKYAKELEECDRTREIRNRAMKILDVEIDEDKDTDINYINHGIKLAKHVKITRLLD